MKLPSICESKWLLMVGFAFILPLLGGCQEDGLPDDEGAEMSLKRVPTNPNYALLPLNGTKWKLVGFADGKKRMIKLAKPAEGYCFLLIFKEQGVLDGYASTNRIRGEYIIESAKENRIKITYFGLVTYINEVFDGPKYIESMRKINFSQISSMGLELYYDSDAFLLFKPSDVKFPEY